MDNIEPLLKNGTASAGVAALLFSGLLRSQNPALKLKPTRLSCAGFGAAFALGTFMIADGDYKNGTGFISTWGLLYSMVNGRQILRGPMFARLAGVAALSVGGLYAREFIRTNPDNPEAISKNIDMAK